jgi:hypothetical protein
VLGPHHFAPAPRSLDRVIDTGGEVGEAEVALVVSRQVPDQPTLDIVEAGQWGRAHFEMEQQPVLEAGVRDRQVDVFFAAAAMASSTSNSSTSMTHQTSSQPVLSRFWAAKRTSDTGSTPLPSTTTLTAGFRRSLFKPRK